MIGQDFAGLQLDSDSKLAAVGQVRLGQTVLNYIQFWFKFSDLIKDLGRLASPVARRGEKSGSDPRGTDRESALFLQSNQINKSQRSRDL